MSASRRALARAVLVSALVLVARLALGPAGASAQARAPSGAPLVTTGGQPTGTEGGEEEAGGAPQSEADPLVGNGLGSPLCKGALGAGELSSANRSDCETSGFVAATAPTDNYGLDVHIDTGVLGLSTGGLLTAVQDLFVQPLWMALVWAVHALVVMLEWCFTIDLMDSASAAGLAGRLRAVQAEVTEPWLALVLAVASILALYNGLIRRQVAETAGQALLMLAMTAGGMWVILDPTGTIGALGRWANQASLGTLAVTARSRPAGAGRALADSLTGVFAAAIEVPWCYLEFGDVGWCRNPARLDPRLQAAGLKIAAGELAFVGCKVQADQLSICIPRGSEQARALEHSAELLRTARSNGSLFLALPANGPARNSINEQGSLLHVMCESSEATSCHGPSAAQAEFRTNRGTWERVGGLLLIVAGVAGLLLLLGFIGLRLLAAAIFSLLLLLLAPAVVLAPALGDAGRMVFRRWAAQLLGAVVSKLLFSFLLGVVLAVVAILADLDALGWWTQWLLMSAFWWGAYARRHQVLNLATGGLAREHQQGPRSLTRRLQETLQRPSALLRNAGRVARKLAQPAPAVDPPGQLARADQRRVPATGDEQLARSLGREHEEARRQVAAAAQTEGRIASMRDRLMRVRRARGHALAGGASRKAASLGAREARIEAEITHEQEALEAARKTLATGVSPRLGTAAAYAKRQRQASARFLDAQAALPSRGRAAGDGARRDYPALAALAGHGRAQYEKLDPRARREARLQIDRELALRRELGSAARVGTRDQLADRPSRNRGGDAAAPRGTATQQRSSVLDDAREVAARRKRQLGRDRP